MPDQPPLAQNGEPKQHFKHHDSYDALMGGSRRKPALPIGGPAVIWHLAFWYPNDRQPERDNWVKTIEKFILQLYDHMEVQKLSPYTHSTKRENQEERFYLLDNSYAKSDKEGKAPRVIADGGARYQTFRVRFYYGSMPTSVTLELHDEYFTLSTIIDLAWPAHTAPCPAGQLSCTVDSALQNDAAIIERLSEAIRKFNDIAGEHRKQAKQNQSEKLAKPAHREAFQIPYHGIYEAIWDAFYDRIFEPSYKPTIGSAGSMLGGIFADFRGFVATAGGSFISGPGEYASKESLAQRIGADFLQQNEVVHFADALLPWLRADRGFAHQDEHREVDRTEPIEFTLSLFLQKRALFATALGAQWSRVKGIRCPMTYIMLTKNPARWEAGRLIDRIHMLATLRLAALYDLPHLIQADAELRDLEDEIKGSMQGDPKKLNEILKKKLAEWSKSFGEIDRQPKKSKTPIAGGLAYRVERSKYYQSQFKEHLGGFGIHRIEGFSPYDEAVNRRLAGDYELIHTVGEHRGRLQETLGGLSRKVQTIEIISETQTIDKLQHNAEKAFFLVLFPYYVSHILIEVADKLQLAQHFPSVEHRLGIDKTFLFVSIVGGATLAFYSSLQERFNISSANARRFNLSLFVIVCVATLLLSAVSARYQIADILPPIAD